MRKPTEKQTKNALMRQQHYRTNAQKGKNLTKGNTIPFALYLVDSPVIYGVRVETSNPYHLLISINV